MNLGFKLLLSLSALLLSISHTEAATIYSTSILKNETKDPLIEAIAKDDIKALRSLIEDGADVNSRNQYGYTPLMAAAYKGDLEICRLLIDAGAANNTCDNNGDNILFFTLYDREKENVLRYLTQDLAMNVNIINKSNRTPLILAALNNHPASIKLLVAAGAQLETLGEWGTALTHAARNGSLKAAQALLELGAQLETRNQDSFTPLMEAVFDNNPAMIQFLLKAGADKTVLTTKTITVTVKKDWADFKGKTVHLPKGSNLIEIARLFDKKAAENTLINEAGF